MLVYYVCCFTVSLLTNVFSGRVVVIMCDVCVCVYFGYAVMCCVSSGVVLFSFAGSITLRLFVLVCYYCVRYCVRFVFLVYC